MLLLIKTTLSASASTTADPIVASEAEGLASFSSGTTHSSRLRSRTLQTLPQPTETYSAQFCNKEITEDTVLTQDIECPNGDGPYVKGGIVFDCDGYSIKGGGTGSGVFMTAPSGNSIKGCFITNFLHGIAFDTRNQVIEDVVVKNNIMHGLFSFGRLPSHITLKNVTVTGNGGHGIYWVLPDVMEDVVVCNNVDDDIWPGGDLSGVSYAGIIACDKCDKVDCNKKMSCALYDDINNRINSIVHEECHVTTTTNVNILSRPTTSNLT